MARNVFAYADQGATASGTGVMGSGQWINAHANQMITPGSFGPSAPGIGNHPGASSYLPMDSLGFGGVPIAVSDNRGAAGVGADGANRDLTTPYMVYPIDANTFRNSVKRYAIHFGERGNTKLPTGVAVTNADTNGTPTMTVLRHLSKVNYDLQVNRGTDGFTSPHQVLKKFWLAGVAKAVPFESAGEGAIMSPKGEIVSTTVMGRVACYDYWSVSYAENRKWARDNGLQNKIRFTRSILQGHPLYFIVVEVVAEKAGIENRMLRSKLGALCGPGMDIKGIQTDQLVHDRDGRVVGVRAAKRPRLNAWMTNRYGNDAEDETYASETASPYHFRIIPVAVDDECMICTDLLRSRAPGRRITGPIGIAIRVGFADTRVKKKNSALDAAFYKSLVCPVEDGEWNNAMNQISLRDIELRREGGDC